MARLQMRAQKQNEARIGMVRRRPVDTRPEGIAGARSRGADVGMAVMTVDSPGVKDPLVVEKLMSRTADVIHDLVPAILLERFTHARGDIIERLIPADALPLSLAPLSDTLERIANPLGICHLIQSGRAFGAVSSPATGMLRVTVESPDTIRFLIDKSQ